MLTASNSSGYSQYVESPGLFMKTKRFWALVLVITLIFGSGMPGTAIAQTPSPVESSSANSSSGSTSLWEKLERLRDDTQLQRLVEDDIEKSLAIHEQIQVEVDRTFSHTTTLLNVLLVILTAMPILAGIGIWFIRRSVLNQIVADTRKQLQEEVEKQLSAEVAEELKQQAAAFQKEIDDLKTEFAAQLDQLRSLFSDAQKEKDKIIQELAQILPSPIRDSTSPEVHQKIQTLTKQLEILKSANSRLSFTANDYVEQGKALYFEGQYEDAIAFYEKAITAEPENLKAWLSRGAALAKLQRYDEAIAAYEKVTALKPDFSEAWFGKGLVLTRMQKYEAAIAAYTQLTDLKPDFYLAWFGKARCYAYQNQIALALTALEKAIALNPDKVKEATKTDNAFEPLRDNEQFQALISS
jgi:tetratricopeptide (TPR) repeat protein